MDQALLERTVTDLVGQLDGAVKYTPMLLDIAEAASKAVPLAELKDKTFEEQQALRAAAEAAAIENSLVVVLAVAQENHDRFIAQLRQEIATDPDGRGYAAMTPEQVAEAMGQEIKITEPIASSTPRRRIVGNVLGSLISRPENLLIGPDGTVLSDHPGLQALIDKACTDSGLTAEELDTPEQERVVEVKPAPFWRVTKGVKYGRNVVRAKEVEETLK